MISENTVLWASSPEKSLLQIACFSANPLTKCSTPGVTILPLYKRARDASFVGMTV